MAELQAHKHLAVGSHKLTCLGPRAPSLRFKRHVRMADVSLSSGQGETDPSKSQHVTEGKAEVDKLLHEAIAAADTATTALEHLNDPHKGHAMKKVMLGRCCMHTTKACGNPLEAFILVHQSLDIAGC